ncbi:MAG: hypothetical protein ABIG66_03685 [Candidatus Kerfeldbacteria bacterium]
MGRLGVILIIVVLLGIGALLLIFDVFNVYGDSETSYQTRASVSVGEPTQWNAEKVTGPTVLFDQEDRLFKMWYVGNGIIERSGIGYATSADGVNWDFLSRPDPLLNNLFINPTGKTEKLWDTGGFTSVSVIKEGNLYRMWYSAREFDDPKRERIGYATSIDGLRWTKNSTNPVLEFGDGTSWDNHSIGQPFVVKDGTTYKMWYTGWSMDKSGDKASSSIGYATSSDGIHWTKYDNNPVFTGGQEWNSASVGGPSVVVVQRNKLYELWFHGVNDNGDSAIGRAYSDDGVRWAVDERNPLMRDSGWNFLEPSIMLEGTTYYAWLEHIENTRSPGLDNIHFTAYPLTLQNNIYIIPASVPTPSQ